jgi:predicted nucleic acid-binding protein
VKVVDASALIDVLTGTARRQKLLAHFDDDLFAPDLLISEVYSFLARMATARRLSRSEADRLALSLRKAPIEYLPVWPYAERMWSWRHNLSPYDAAYVALADDLRAPLVTSDNRLGRAAAALVAVVSV